MLATTIKQAAMFNLLTNTENKNKLYPQVND